LRKLLKPRKFKECHVLRNCKTFGKCQRFTVLDLPENCPCGIVIDSEKIKTKIYSV